MIICFLLMTSSKSSTLGGSCKAIKNYVNLDIQFQHIITENLHNIGCPLLTSICTTLLLTRNET